ncbi:MAG: hypothetical protein ACXAE3_12890 [Candidatus Kariarchaeaceae archaeon]|jgi:hypothetical protein
METDLMPIDAVYILDPSGIPLFARYYQGDINKMDTTLLGGFFSALEIFVKTSLDGHLTDIGMTDNRFFFGRSDSDYIIIIIIGVKGTVVISSETLELINRLQSTINACFNVVAQSAKENMVRAEYIIENLGASMDSFLLETNFELIEDIGDEDSYYENVKGETIGTDELDRLIAEISGND